jgi:hypothetical protein
MAWSMGPVMIHFNEFAGRLDAFAYGLADIVEPKRTLAVIQSVPDDFELIDDGAALNQTVFGKGDGGVGKLVCAIIRDFPLRAAQPGCRNDLVRLMAKLRSYRAMQCPCFLG